MLTEEDGLVGGELLGDVVGLTDLVGFGLPIGRGTTAEGFTTRLDVGVGVGRGLWLTWCVCVAAGELRCCAVLVSAFPLPRPEMCPVRYSPAAAAAAHRTAVEPAAISWRRRLERRGPFAPFGPLRPRGGTVPGSSAPGRALVPAAGRSARVAPGYPGSAGSPMASASRIMSARSATTRTLAGRSAGVLASMW